MSMITLELPAPLFAFAKEQAAKCELSIEAWLVRELELHMKLHQETEEFFRIRRERAAPGAWCAALAAIPNNPSDPGDEID